MSFNPSETVMLKSGGPQMTVREVSADCYTVKCTWFDGNELKEGEFQVVTLDPLSGLDDSIFYKIV